MAVSPALARAYAVTAYHVHLPSGACVVSVGAPAPVIDAYCAAHGCDAWGIITAVNPASVPLADAENTARQAVLRQELGDHLMCSAENVDPAGRWPVEPALWVGGLSLAAMLSLAAHHGQWAIVYAECGQPARLEWTSVALRTVESGP